MQTNQPHVFSSHDVSQHLHTIHYHDVLGGDEVLLYGNVVLTQVLLSALRVVNLRHALTHRARPSTGTYGDQSAN